MTWTCSACGADNDGSVQICEECGGDRAGDVATPKRPESDTFEDNIRLPETVPDDLEGEKREDEEDEEAVEADDDDDDDHDDDEEEEKVAPPPGTIISSPLSSIETPPEPKSESYFQPTPEPAFRGVPEPVFQRAPEPTFQPTGNDRYYLVFVNTPAHSLVKSKVPIEFDVFPVITIGRSPENVIVIPDQEVSRKHAELTTERGRLVIKDLESKNGTFVYDGKKFEQVTGSAEVKPNTILKFGTGTIVRLVSE
jgi:hypothetical protein